MVYRSDEVLNHLVLAAFFALRGLVTNKCWCSTKGNCVAIRADGRAETWMSRKAHPHFGHLSKLPTPAAPRSSSRARGEPLMRPEDQEGLLWAPFRSADCAP